MATTGRNYELKAVFSARDNASRTFTALEKRIDKLQKKMEMLDKKEATLRLNVTGDKKVEKALDDIEIKLNKFKGNKNVSISLTGDRPVATKAEKLEKKIKEATEDREVKFGAKTAELDNSVKRLRAQLTRFENDDIEVNFNANDAAMLAKAKTSKRTLDTMFAKAVNAELNLNGDRETIARAQAAQSAISKVAKRYQMQIDYANAMQTDAKIRKTNEEADRAAKKRDMRFEARGDEAVRAKIRNIQTSATELTMRPYEVDLLGDASQALRILRSTESEMRRYSTAAYQATIKAEQRGMPEVAGQARALQQQLNAMESNVTKVRTELEGVPPVLAGLAVVKRSAEGVEGNYEVKIQYRSLLSASGAALAVKSAVSGLGSTLRQTMPLSEAFARKIYIGQQALQGFAGAAIAVGVAAIGPLVAGFTILIASLGAAATGFGLLALAALPIIKAFSQQAQRAQEVQTAQKALATSSEQVASAQKGLASAQRGVAEAARSGSEGIRSAIKAQKDAIESVGDAQRALGEANAGVADARKAKEESVRQAVLAVADAYRGVQDAQRAVGEAQQGVADARRAGEDGIRSAINAQKDAYRGLQDAQRSLGDAHRGVVEARKQGEESVRSAIQAQADAYRGLQDAQRSLSDAHRGVSDARKAREEGITTALKQQEDAQRAVRDAVISLGDAHQNQRDLTRATALATEDFNRALKDEKYNIQDLKYEMQGFGLDQRELTLDIAEARKELANAEDPTERARAQIQLERLLLRQKQLTNEQRDAQQRLNDAQRNGTDELQSARSAREAAWKAEVDGMRNIKSQERALADARRAALEAEQGVTQARLEGDRQVSDALRGVKDAQRGVSDAIRAVGEAERNVNKARQDAAKQVADAQRGVAEAQRGVRDAIEAIGEADRNVAKARADAAKQVADAQKGVLEAQRGLKDAIRAVGEAERNVTKARLDGNKQIKDAQLAVLDAQRNLKDAIEAVGEADRNVAKARQDAARQMADAQRAVRDAQLALTKALKEQQTAQQKLNSLMAKQPAYIQRIMDKVGQLKNAYKVAFAEANVAVGRLIERVLDLAIRAMPKMGETAFRTANRVNTAFNNIGRNWQVYGGVKSLIRIMNYVPRITQQWTEAFGNFGGAFTNIMAIAMPYALRFSQAVNRAGEAFFRWTNSENGRKRINKFFRSAAPVAKALGDVIWDIGGAILNWSIDHPKQIAAAIRTLGRWMLALVRFTFRVINGLIGFRKAHPILWDIVKALGIMYLGLRVLRGPLLMIQKLWGVLKFLGIGTAAKRMGILGTATKTAGGKAGKAKGQFSGLGKTAKGAAKGGAPGLVLAGRQAATANARAGKGAKGFTNLGQSVVTGGKNAKGGIVPITNVGNKSQLAGQKAMKGGKHFKTLGTNIATGGKNAKGGIVPITKAGGAVKGAGGKAATSAGKFALFRGGIKKVGLSMLRFVGLGNPVIGALVLIGTALVTAYRRSETFRKYIKGVLDQLKKSKEVKKLGRDLKELGTIIKNDLWQATKWAGRQLAKFFGLFARGGKSGSPERAIRGTVNVIEFLVKAVRLSIWVFKLEWRILSGFVRFLAQVFNRVIKDVGKDVNGMKRAWNGVVTFFQRLPGRIGKAIKGIGRIIAAPFKWAYNRIIGNSIVPDMVSGVIKSIGSIPGAVRKALRGLGGIIGNPFKQGEKQGNGALGKLAKGARNWTGKAKNWITDNTTQAKNSSNKNHSQMNKKASEQLKMQANETERRMVYAKKQIHENTLKGNKSAVKHYTEMYKKSKVELVNLKSATANQTKEAEKKSTKNTQTMQEKGARNARDFRDFASKAIRELKDRVADRTNEAENKSTKNTQRMQEKGARNSRDFRDFASKAIRELKDRIADRTNEAENKSTKNTQRMQEKGAQNSRDYRNIVDKVFKEIRDFMVDPIGTARDRLQKIWNGILDGIAKVLGAVGMDKAQKKVTGAKWAKGGVTSDPSSVQTFAKGGLGTGTKKPRVHVWNEQMGNEAYIAERGNRKDSLNYLNTAAKWHDAEVVDKRSYTQTIENAAAAEQKLPKVNYNGKTLPGYDPRPIRQNVADAPNFSNWHRNVYDYIAERANGIKSKVGNGINWNTYQDHITSPGANEWSSVDFWNGNPGSTISRSNGDAVVNEVLNNYMKGMLGMAWQRRILYGGSWHPFPQAPHTNHVHVGWSSDKNSKIVQGTGGSSGIMDSIWNRVAEPIWNKIVDKPLDAFAKSMAGGNVMKEAAGKAPQHLVTDPIKEMLMEKFNVSSGSGTGSITPFSGKWATAKGGSPSENRGIAQAAAKEVGWSNQWSAWDELGNRESGWNRTARNPSSGAYGIPQALPESKLPPGGRSSGGSQAGPQIAWMVDYIKGRYTDPKGAIAWHNSHNWYAKGGMAKYTNGGMARREQTAVLGDNPKGEIMWPLGDVRATRAISKAVQEGSRAKVSQSSTNTTSTIGGKAQSQRVDTGSAQVVDAIEKMKNELRETLREELSEIEIGEQSLRTMYDAGFNQALKALASKKGRDIIDEQMGDDIDFHTILGGSK